MLQHQVFEGCYVDKDLICSEEIQRTKLESVTKDSAREHLAQLKEELPFS